MDDDWEWLVEKFAGDKLVCNCRWAYYADYTDSRGGHFCAHGCQANQIHARNEIAAAIRARISELESSP